MEQLILFVVILVVSFLFNRSKNNPQKNRRIPNPPPITAEVEDIKTVEQVDENRLPNQSGRTLRESANVLIEQPSSPSIDKVEEKMEELKQVQQKQREKISALQEHLTRDPVTQSREFRFEADDVVSGIIMSEILGPPRAKKPYQRR